MVSGFGWHLRLPVLAVVIGAAVALGSSRAGGEHAEGDLPVRAVLRALACADCEEPDSPEAPVNARLHVEVCGEDAECERGGDVRITVTYLWPGGDPATGLHDGAQTCIRWFAEPPEMRQARPGYAFGGDCGTNVSGTSDEFMFSGREPVLFCAQVDAFRGTQALGSSNLACARLEQPAE